MKRKYELFVNGKLATRCLTLNGAARVAAKFPEATRTIYRLIPEIKSILVLEFAKGAQS